MGAKAQIGASGPSEPPPIQGPTLEETLAWITNKINSYTAHPTYRKRIVFSGCKFDIFNAGDANVRGEAYSSASLVDLDSEGIKIISNGTVVFIYTMRRDDLVEYYNKYAGSEYKWYTKKMEDFISAYTASTEDSESLANGFKHAIKLCQRQASADKAARRQKSLF